MKFMKMRGRVFDFVCGVGGFLFFLEDFGFEVVGFDNSRFMLEKVREFVKEKEFCVEFIEGDVREFLFENDSFDYVFFIDSFVYFEFQDLVKVFKEIVRVLKFGGKFIFQFIDLRVFLLVFMNGQVVGVEYWVNKVLLD